MIWDPPIHATVLLLAVIAAASIIVAGFVLARRQMSLDDPAALAGAGLRGLAFLVLLFVLLQPAKLPRPQTVEAPRTFAVLLDTSGSMSVPDSHVPGTPTRLDRARRVLEANGVFDQVSKQAKLVVYGFDARAVPVDAGSVAGLAAEGRGTDVAGSVAQVVTMHEHEDLAGLLVLTDGRSTARNRGGTNLTSAANETPLGKRPNPLPDSPSPTLPLSPSPPLPDPLPVFAYPVGRPKPVEVRGESPARDLAIDSVVTEPRIILGREARVSVSVAASGYAARQVPVELVQDGTVIRTSAVAVSPQQPRRQALFTVSPAVVGEHAFEVRIPVDPDETDSTNNAETFTIEVVDPVNRVLYIDGLRNERRFFKPVLEARRTLRY